MDGRSEERNSDRAERKKCEVLMWEYFPGVAQQRSPLTSPEPVRITVEDSDGDSWKDVCGGGCGFGMALTDKGKLVTWGSADDQGQSYLTSGKHGESPEIYPLPTNDLIVKAAAGWAHCVSATDKGEVYTWGWKECVPSGKFIHGLTNVKNSEDEIPPKKSSSAADAGSPRSQGSKSIVGAPHSNDKKAADENTKRRKIETPQEFDPSIYPDETLSMPPCLVNMDPGIKITSVAAGGRHSLALSDVGQVWGWGYGGEGQLGLGTKIKMVASPHLIPCINPLSNNKGSTSVANQEIAGPGAQSLISVGNYIKGIACGGRHSAVLTDTGVLLAFGWGQYGQCGQGNNDDLLKPTCVSSLLGNKTEAVAAGLWHTICIGADGRVHAFGGNQFGQLGLGTSSEQCEKPSLLSTTLGVKLHFNDDGQTIPRLIDAPVLEGRKAKIVSSGARHSAIVTEDSKIFCWGWNKYGQLGLGDTMDRNLPSQVPLDGHIPKNVSCGWWHTLSLCDTAS